MTHPIAAAARRAYWKFTSAARGSESRYPPDFTPSEIATLEFVREMTLTTHERVVSLIRAVDYVVRSGVAGDIVECGVWRGGSMAAVARTLVQHGDTSRQLYLYDTFDGMPPPTDKDKDYLGNSAESQMAVQDKDAIVWARAQIDEVKANMAGTGYPEACLHYVKGKVEDTIPSETPATIALLRLDTDWYESTRHEMEHLFPRLVPGGVLILDDYGHWEGARRAVDEYIAQHRLRILLCRIDASGRIAIKT